MPSAKWRLAAGALALVFMATVATQVAPPYVQNLRFQRRLERIVQQAAASGRSDDLLRVDILNEAARLGLPLRESQVRIRRTPGRLEAEALYAVPVGRLAYAVDLHFRPRARVP